MVLRSRLCARGIAAFGIAGALALSACASTTSNLATDFSRQVRERGFPSNTVVVPFAISPEMAEWVHTRVSRDEPTEARLERLFLAVMTELDLRYEAGHTGTAAQVFAEKRANCLGFTSLFVGLAREVGIPAFYLAVEDVERFQRDGDLVVVSSHVSAAFDTGAGLKVLDFTLAPVARAREAHRLDDVAAAAQHYSNVGAEKLRAGEIQAALAEFRVAVALDPTLAGARTNLGVALRRAGDVAGAEAAYRRALEIDPNALSAYQNLAALLRLLGREQESIELLHIAEQKGTKNPYSFLSLGDLSMRFERLDEAKRFYRRALRLYRKDAEPYAAMGLWALASGDRRAAVRWLERAKSIDALNQRVLRLAAKLG